MINFEPKQMPTYIKVLGVGGGGSNAVNNMFKQGIKGVEFVVCNTDVQALDQSPVPVKVVLGDRVLGAGNKPEVGRAAAEMSIEKLKEVLTDNTQMLFITAGMGGGTGTGAAPIIAKAARELNILTVGIVTLPFSFEGRRRMEQAKKGIQEFKDYVDTLLVICNDKMRELYGDVSLSEAFAHADDVLTSAAKGIAELITVPGYVNIDFEDVKTVIENSGKAIMGSALAEGENRARVAIEDAMNSPLLNDNDIKGAKNILLYIMTGEEEIKMDEISEITDYVRDECGNETETNVIWGSGQDENLGKKLSITIIATGFEKKKETIKKITRIGEIGKDEKKDRNEAKNKDEQPLNKIQEEKKEETSELRVYTKEKTENAGVPGKPEENGLFKEWDEKTEPEIRKKETSLFDYSGDQKLAIGHTVGSHNPEQAKKELDRYVTPSGDDDLMEQNSAQRKEMLKRLSMVRPEQVEELEKEPAYLRKNVNVDDPPPSSDTIVSRYTLGEDSKNNPLIKTDNTFLHDNVD
ncbi:MAG: cell division protein FtsZ [Chlorobi bacterium]|nr:cell division protein FtsZ [Chlorobiota bacterium]